MSNVQHKSVIEVNEEGSVAAAATAAIMSVPRSRIGPRYISMIFDRPFYFILQDKTHGVNLFMGRIVDPSNGKNEIENIPKNNVTQKVLKNNAIKKSKGLDPRTMVIL